MIKKILLAIVCIAALLFGVTFTIKNAQVVELTYYFGINWQGPLSWLIIIVLILGMLAGIFLCFMSSLLRKLKSNSERGKSQAEST